MQGTVLLGQTILIESGLSYLGLGAQPPTFRLEAERPHISASSKLTSHLFFERKTGHYELANFEGSMEGEIGIEVAKADHRLVERQHGPGVLVAGAPQAAGVPMGGIMAPFNSSNTAEESAAVTSSLSAAKKWRT